jgi:hypothetical protein
MKKLILLQRKRSLAFAPEQTFFKTVQKQKKLYNDRFAFAIG